MKSSTKKKMMFVQDSGIFGDEFFVVVGLSYDEIIKGAKNLKATKKFFESMKDAHENYWDRHVKEDAGGVLIDEHNHAFLMRFNEWSDSWDFWEKLLHECVHVVQSLERSKRIQNEDECRAYTTEYLFHHIRRKLMGIEPSEQPKKI